MRLILIRHGETEENVKSLVMGQGVGGILTEKGIGQAKRLANHLKSEKIDVIYSSDLQRAADTAKEIAKFHEKIPLHLIKELRERNYGEVEGQKRPPNWRGVAGDVTWVPKSGESIPQMYARAAKLVDDILHKHKDDVVLFVTHYSFYIAITAHIMQLQPEDANKLPTLSNTSVSIFDLNENKEHKVVVYNSTKHLA